MARSERSYGSFYRAIPLPQGARTDEARARFENGVLEISVPVPEQQQAEGASRSKANPLKRGGP